jgi:hypothetical protein
MVENQRQRLSLIILGIFSLPVTFVCFFFMLFVTEYGNQSVPAAGLLPGVIVLLSEIFAVVCEAALITVLSKGALSWRQAGVMSLLTNTISFLWGLLIFGL